MPKIVQLLKRFKADERGAFLVLFGVLSLVLIATAGAVVDFTTIEQARTRAQDALDSAALGLQPTIYESGVTEASVKIKAQELLEERLNDESVVGEITDVDINTTDGMLQLTAKVTIPMAFVSLVGVQEIDASIVSEATRKRLNIEVAMVLDNSGSMNQQSRMTNLKAAATCAANILFNGDCDSTDTTASVDTVKIGIVPFTSFVNVGTNYKTASWMDTTGASDYADDNFDDDDNYDADNPPGLVNRFALYDQLTNVDWQGCVEARPYPYDTNDTTPSASDPNTLFVPEFAPDNPDDSWGFSNNYLDDDPSQCRATCERKQVTTRCDRNGNNCSGSTTETYTLTTSGGFQTIGACTCSGQTYVTDQTSLTKISGSNYTKTRTRTCYLDADDLGLSDRERQERMCKYHGSIDTGWFSGDGPNEDCPTNSLLPLTNTKSSVKTAINAMYPQGNTNIHQGAIWGFHMLSPTEPLTEGRPYTSATYKVMIVMTDGENTYAGYNRGNMNGGSGFWAYGYPWNNPDAPRMKSDTYPNPQDAWSDAQLIASLNARTVETCNNAKAAGIAVYTIGLSSPNETTRQMLRDCSSGSSYAYFPTQSSELKTVFAEIASQLSNLRLAK